MLYINGGCLQQVETGWCLSGTSKQSLTNTEFLQPILIFADLNNYTVLLMLMLGKSVYVLCICDKKYIFKKLCNVLEYRIFIWSFALCPIL